MDEFKKLGAYVIASSELRAKERARSPATDDASAKGTGRRPRKIGDARRRAANLTAAAPLWRSGMFSLKIINIFKAMDIFFSSSIAS